MIGCRPFTADEIRRIEAAFTGDTERRDRCLFVMGYTTGFRISELLALRVRDVMAGPNIATEIRVPRRHMKGRKVSGSAATAPRLVPVLSEWLDEIEALDLLQPDLPLYLSRKHLRPITRQQAWRVLVAAYTSAGIFGPEFSLGTHTMRKTYAARMYERFGDIFKVQKALRHASPASTVAYLSFAESELREAVDLSFPTTEEESANVLQFNAAGNDD